jgi:hypothetical protein
VLILRKTVFVTAQSGDGLCGARVWVGGLGGGFEGDGQAGPVAGGEAAVHGLPGDG